MTGCSYNECNSRYATVRVPTPCRIVNYVINKEALNWTKKNACMQCRAHTKEWKEWILTNSCVKLKTRIEWLKVIGTGPISLSSLTSEKKICQVHIDKGANFPLTKGNNEALNGDLSTFKKPKKKSFKSYKRKTPGEDRSISTKAFVQGDSISVKDKAIIISKKENKKLREDRVELRQQRKESAEQASNSSYIGLQKGELHKLASEQKKITKEKNDLKKKVIELENIKSKFIDTQSHLDETQARLHTASDENKLLESNIQEKTDNLKEVNLKLSNLRTDFAKLNRQKKNVENKMLKLEGEHDKEKKIVENEMLKLKYDHDKEIKNLKVIFEDRLNKEKQRLQNEHKNTLQKEKAKCENILKKEKEKSKNILQNINILQEEKERYETSLREENTKYERLNNEYEKHKQTYLQKLTYHFVCQSDKLTRFYTGFSHVTQFQSFMNMLIDSGLKDQWSPKRKKKITFEDGILLTLLKLRQNFYFHHLGYLFSCAGMSASRYFWTGLEMIHQFLMHPSINPFYKITKRFIDDAMLPCFKNDDDYAHTALIIDATELFIETPTNEDFQKMTWSNYKHHNTVKLLITISSTGHVVHCSAAHGGHISDNDLTFVYKEIFDVLWDGAGVMADKGFTIEDILPHGIVLNLPPFSKKGLPFSLDEKTKTKQIASTRIHVERAISRAKRFKILSDEVELHKLNYIDIVAQTCFLLTNYWSDLVDTTDF
eukprot:Pgem_evm1s11388